MIIRGTMRRAITWTALVIVSLNIESAVSKAGYDTVIDHHWRDVFPMVKLIHSILTSPWLWYPTLLLIGALTYEWLIYVSDQMDKPRSPYQRWLISSNANTLAAAFLSDGIYRRTVKPDREIAKMNRRLADFGLPLVPSDFNNIESVNQAYGSYLTLLAKDQAELAIQLIWQWEPANPKREPLPQ